MRSATYLSCMYACMYVFAIKLLETSLPHVPLHYDRYNQNKRKCVWNNVNERMLIFGKRRINWYEYIFATMFFTFSYEIVFHKKINSNTNCQLQISKKVIKINKFSFNWFILFYLLVFFKQIVVLFINNCPSTKNLNSL